MKCIFVCLSVYLCQYTNAVSVIKVRYMSHYVCLYLSSSVCISLYDLSVCLSVCVSSTPMQYPWWVQAPWTIMSVCLSVCLCVSVNVCLSVCLVHLCSIRGESKLHEPLCLAPNTAHNFCIFSVVFSQDNNELLGGYVSNAHSGYDSYKQLFVI